MGDALPVSAKQQSPRGLAFFSRITQNKIGRWHDPHV